MTINLEGEHMVALGKALKALTYEEMMETSAMLCGILESNRGPTVKQETLARSLDEFLEMIEPDD